MTFASTKKERQRVKHELSMSFDRWNKMTDEELLEQVRQVFPAIAGPPIRGECLKFLTMNLLDQID